MKNLKQVKIGNFFVGKQHPVFIIAEAGINHNGSYPIAKKMVDVAKKCGVQCIKFQTHITEKEMLKTNIRPASISKRTLWNIIKNCELTEREEEKIKQYCKYKKILFLSTPFSKEAVDRLEKINVVAYKIGSGEVTNFPLLNYVAEKNKPVILSTGMSTMKEIRDAVNIFKRFQVSLILLQTTSTYPTKYKDVKLGLVEKFEKIFKIPIGISDHSVGIYTCLGAVAKGACMVEKHFTLDNKMSGPDQKFSLEPKELSELVKGCQALKMALGDKKVILPNEKPILRFARGSIVSIKNILKGEIFTDKNISIKRPSTGPIPAREYFRVIGKRAKRKIPHNKQLTRNDVL